VDTWESRLVEEVYSRVAGLDEAGRGPLAGPVVAAAIILRHPLPMDLGIVDSKAISPARRDSLLPLIYSRSVSVGLGISWHDEIESLNIHNASLLAMKRAVERLSPCPDFLLIDGKFTIDNPCLQKALVAGESKSVSIAAASIIAKTARDRIMASYAGLFPGYGFARHKGYGTKYHREAIKRLGPCPVHRKTYRGVLQEKE